MREFRLIPAMSGRHSLQMADHRRTGNYGTKLWQTIDTMEDVEWALDRLAVCEGRMTPDECARRFRARRKLR